MQFSSEWLGLASSTATVIALVVTLLYYVYWWPFHLRKPEGLNATPDHNRVTLSWQSVRRASNYNIYRTNESGVMDVFSSSTHHYTDTTAAIGATYQYHVIAEDQGHQSPPSDSLSVAMKIPHPLLSPQIPSKQTPIKSTPVDDDSPETQWTVEDLHRLYPLLQNNKTVLMLLEMTTAKPGALVSFHDVCERAGVTRRQGGAGIAGLTVLIKRLSKTRWPFTYHPSKGSESVPYYKVSEAIAERWRQVESGVNPLISSREVSK